MNRGAVFFVHDSVVYSDSPCQCYPRIVK